MAVLLVHECLGIYVTHAGFYTILGYLQAVLELL